MTFPCTWRQTHSHSFKKPQVFCNVTLSCWVSSSSSFEGLYCFHIQGHTVQQEYPQAETCYVSTTDGGTGWPETAGTVGPKRCVKDTVQWRRSSMSNYDQGRQGIRDTVQAEVQFWLAWLSSQSAGPWKWRHYTFKTLQTSCSTREHHMSDDFNLQHTNVRTSNLPSYSFLI